jgi:hypothetical protein
MNGIRNAWNPISTAPTRSSCCARCRRGTPSLGSFPCALNLDCRCHGGKP